MARKCLFLSEKSIHASMEEESPHSAFSNEGSQQPSATPGTCEAAEVVKRLLAPIQPKLMSDLNTNVMNDEDYEEPLVDFMTRTVEGYLEETYKKLLRLEGQHPGGRLDPVNCAECGVDCLSHTVLELHIAELHNPFAAASSTQTPSYNCPVPWCSERLPCPASRLVHACRAHGLPADSRIFSVLKQT